MARMAAFSRIIRQLQLHPGTPVAVAVSGGSDSIALTHLCRHAFEKVLAITVDHRLAPDSRSEVEKVGETVRGMGVEHQILTLDWDEMPRESKVRMHARLKRYGALLEACQERDVGVLMMAHHQDDQLESFLFRLARGSGIDSLAGKYPVSFWPANSAIKIVRPLLKWTKEELVQVCQEAGLQWVEDLTNAHPIYLRNLLRQVLASHAELYPGLQQLTDICEEARRITDRAVTKAIGGVHRTNSKMGYIGLKVDSCRRLSQPVAVKTLSILLQYMSGVGLVYNSNAKRLYDCLKNPDSFSPFTIGGCIVDPTPREKLGVILVTKQFPNKFDRFLTPIHIGETVLWDRRFEITLKPLGTESQTQRSRNEIGGLHTVGETTKPSYENREKRACEDRPFYIRHMLRDDVMVAWKGIRRVKSAVLPPESMRGGLPVIIDDRKKIVLVPHLQVIDRSAGVTCRIAFKPRLEDVIHMKEKFANQETHAEG